MLLSSAKIQKKRKKKMKPNFNFLTYFSRAFLQETFSPKFEKKEKNITRSRKLISRKFHNFFIRIPSLAKVYSKFFAIFFGSRLSQKIPVSKHELNKI